MTCNAVFVLKKLLAVSSFCRHWARAGCCGAGRIDGRRIDYERNTQRRHDGSFVDQAIPKSMLGTFVPERPV